ncbi:MAG: hypothetical protein C0594_13475 [Marinilabiliales bacterium]|nr:MAG: hypothetical protein C0594_13475 [Marinilabiliales bacterium]
MLNINTLKQIKMRVAALLLFIIAGFSISFANDGYGLFASNNLRVFDHPNSKIGIFDDSKHYLSNASLNDSVPKSEDKLGAFGIHLDPLGALFYGPNLALEFALGNHIIIYPQYTWNYAGLLYRLEISGFERIYSSSSSTYTIGIKYLPNNGKVRLFMGFNASYGAGSHITYDYMANSKSGTYFYSYSFLIPASQVGVKFRLNGFVISSGISFGWAFRLSNTEYNYDTKELNTTGFGHHRYYPISFTFTLGFETK